MDKNVMWLAIFVVMLGSGIACSYFFVPGCHWINEPIFTTEKITVYAPDGEELGYVMIPVAEDTHGHWTVSFRHVAMAELGVILVILGCAGISYNIARLRGWEPKDC